MTNFILGILAGSALTVLAVLAAGWILSRILFEEIEK